VGWYDRESLDEAEKEIMGLRNFARWDRDALRHYIRGAVVKVDAANNVLDPEAKFALSCHPLIEASLYCSGGQKLTEDQMRRVKCPITFQYGARSQLFTPEPRQQLVDAYPHIYSIAAGVPNTSHALVMEDPATCTSRIVDALEKLPSFAFAASAVASKL
jgi:pimeloyl-ACP methyl ester carboxylesterase